MEFGGFLRSSLEGIGADVFSLQVFSELMETQNEEEAEKSRKGTFLQYNVRKLGTAQSYGLCRHLKTKSAFLLLFLPSSCHA